MFCSNCGAKLDDSAKFCPECGHPVNASGTVPAPVAETPAAPAFDTASAASVSGEVPVFQMPGTQPVIEQDPTVNQAPILEMPASSAPQTFSNVDPEPFRQDAPSYPEPIQFPEPPVFPDDPQPAAQTAQQSAPLYQQSSSIYQQPSAGTQTASANATQYNLNSTGQLPPTTGTYNTAAVQDNGKKSKKGSNSRYILPIIIVGLLIAAGWYFLFGGNSSNEPKVTDPTQLEEYQIAVEAFDSGDYETAEQIFMDLYEEYPDSVDVYHNLFETYKKRVVELTDDYQYDEAEKRMKMLEIMSADDTGEIMEGFYLNWIAAIYYGECEGDLEEVIEKATPYLSEENLELVKSLIVEEPDFSIEMTASEIAHDIDADELMEASVLTYYYGYEILDEMAAGSYEPLIVEVSGTEYPYVVFYAYDEDSVAAYYGQLDANGVRSGEGYIVTARYDDNDEPECYYYFADAWKDDLPNGSFYELIYYGEQLEYYDMYSGTLKDGLYDGDLFITMDGTTYDCPMNDGIHTVLDTDEDGNKVIGYDIEGSGAYLYISEDRLGLQYGVELYV